MSLVTIIIFKANVVIVYAHVALSNLRNAHVYHQ